MNRCLFVCVLGMLLLVSAAGATDAPHNEARGASCGACHGTSVLSSPFWEEATDERYDNLCLFNCHNAAAAPYTDTGAPLAKTHSSTTTSDKYGTWRVRCVDCHNPHFQEQKLWKTTDADQLFLATGEISGYSYDAASNTSTLTYTTIQYKAGWDAGAFTGKTESGRGAILLPNLRKIGYSFPVVAIDSPTASTITVRGDIRPVYTYVSPPTDFGIIYGQYVRRYVTVAGSKVPVKFFGPTGTNSFADDDTIRDGICQVCHTQTSHWSPTAENDGDNHHAGEDCMECHPHKNGFAHGGDGTGPLCMSCHDSGTHTDHLSMGYTCSACHDLANMRDGGGTIIDPRTTGACAVCHQDGRGGPPNHTDYTTGWDDPAYDLSCDGCHSGRPFLDTLVMATDGHDRLVGEAGIRQYPCYYCHNDTVDASWNLTSNHCNGTVDVAVASPQWALQDQDPPAQPTYDPVSKTCSNIYCHSDGTTVDPEVRPYPWDGGPKSCNSCHGHDPADNDCSTCHGDSRTWSPELEWLSAMPMYANTGAGTARANSHYRHLFTGYACDDCHANTVAGGGCLTCHTDADGNPVVPSGQMSDAEHVNGTYHVNKAKDIAFKEGGTYDPATKTCSNTACHTGATDPVWGGSVNDEVTCLECHGTTGGDVDDFGAFNGTQARIDLDEWATTGHGRPASAGNYPQTGNPPADFPSNGCWYCHDNSVLHKDSSNPYRLRRHTFYQQRFAKECVYCHMAADSGDPNKPEESQCMACHNDPTGETLAPQLVDIGADTAVNPPYTMSRPDHSGYTDGNTVCYDCHTDDDHRHKTGSDIVWTQAQKEDVENQYVMMGVCLICHDDDSGGQCTTCHTPPTDDPDTPDVDESLKYSLGFDPGIAGLPRIAAAQAKASSVHFGYKHYAAYESNGIWKGGKFCWDCHDPHGDGNIAMIQDEVATETDGTFGIPQSRATVSFTRKQSGLDYARIAAPYDGICNVCHTESGMHYRSDYGDSHNAGRLCTNCHEHRFTDSHAGGENCNTCHQNKPVPRHTAFGQPRDCTKCHQGAIGKRMDIMGQFAANSHHVQGVEVTGKHCYACHWEATSLGLINTDYHGGYNPKTHTSTKDDKVDLVIWGAGVRPTIYDLDGSITGTPTATTFTAANLAVDLATQRQEVAKVTLHCLGCHSDQNNDTEPFGDCRTPRQYAWDRSSIAARYSNTGTTTWGKYTSVTEAAPKNFTKAFSAHGNATSNEGGYDTATGLDEDLTGKNTRAGAYNVECFDCHSSHGSKAQGVTSSYRTFNGTFNGGNLKETQAGKGGYTITYVASANPNPNSVNPYNTGAGLCFDCHESADTSSTPWGYNATFGATAPIIGYMDNPHFNGSYNGRYAWRADQGFTTLGGHLRPSHENSASPNYDPNADVPASSPINGLCTPCHDPHGVSPSLGDDMAYAVPLLKGTWLTSPYKEDDAPTDTSNYHRYSPMLPTWKTDRAVPTWSTPDQKIFPNGMIDEDETRFAGLCLGCHAKADLTDGIDKNTAWKSVDRIHESVKGWGNNAEHNYPCSKCHKPHASGLPRLLRTNCLDGKHRGQVLSGGVVHRYNSYRTFPTGGVNGVGWRPACHESPQAGGGGWAEQYWNTVTPW